VFFFVDHRTNSNYFPIQHSLAGFYNRDLTLYSPLVNICTTSLIFTNSTFCPHSVFVCFVWITEQTAIIFLYSVNWLLQERFNPLNPSGYYMYQQFNIRQFYVLPTLCIYVFCADLRKTSDYFPIQHKLTGFYNQKERVYCAVRKQSSNIFDVNLRI